MHPPPRSTRVLPRSLVLLAAILGTTLGTGCAIHTQAPVREVAYDFSDADFYDRHYAPSPDYRRAPEPRVVRRDGRLREAPARPLAPGSVTARSPRGE